MHLRNESLIVHIVSLLKEGAIINNVLAKLLKGNASLLILFSTYKYAASSSKEAKRDTKISKRQTYGMFCRMMFYISNFYLFYLFEWGYQYWYVSLSYPIMCYIVCPQICHTHTHI